MNRTLRRPMFRMGGTAEGITSGLAPRQGYKGTKNPSDQRVLQDILQGMTIGQMRDLSRDLSYKPRGASMRDFLINFGLDIASRPPSGSIFSTAAAAAKTPFERYTGAKQSAAEQQYASESDMFKTMLGAQADILAAQAEGGAKTYAHRDRYAMIKDNVEQQIKLRSELDNPETTEERRTEIINEIKVLRKAASDPEFSKAMLKFIQDDREMRNLKTMIKRQVAEKLGIDPETEFTEGEVGKNFYNEYQKRLSEILGDYAIGIPPTFESGGRVGYALAGSVMGAGDTQEPQPGERSYEELRVAGQRQGPMDQGTAPEDTAGITYEELRARLPQEVTDDIVRLIANSAEALEDFAMIQTEQDINIFNKKYGVNLVLPSEG